MKPWYERLTRRGRIVVFIVAFLLVSGFTYATRDICYVGNMPGNVLGYGSCNAMLDAVVGK